MSEIFRGATFTCLCCSSPANLWRMARGVLALGPEEKKGSRPQWKGFIGCITVPLLGDLRSAL